MQSGPPCRTDPGRKATDPRGRVSDPDPLEIITLQETMTMNATRIIGFASAGLLAIAGAAFAHEMDTDQDGLYSLSEMQTEYADLTQQDYDALDTSKDGAVDAEELTAAIENGTLPSME